MLVIIPQAVEWEGGKKCLMTEIVLIACIEGRNVEKALVKLRQYTSVNKNMF